MILTTFVVVNLIANPSKFIPHWNELYPERQQALINKTLPADIQYQQKPYVIQQKNGQAFDKHGNLIQPEKLEAQALFPNSKSRKIFRIFT